jgi:HlyD family secretion protein
MKRTVSSELRSALWPAVLVACCALLLSGGCSRASRDAGEEIRLSGNIEAVDAQLGFKIPGRVVERVVDEGGRVKAGQLLARLDDAELACELDLRRAELAGAEAVLAELEAGTRPQEIAAAEAAVRSAEAEQERAQLEFRRQQELRASDAVAAREFEAAQAQIRVAEARVAELRQRLALLREGPRRETIAQARARVAQAQAALALGETRLANTRLESPLSGVVLEKHAEPGEFVAAGAPVLTVADTSHVWLRVYINQTELGRVKLGQPVDVHTDSFPDRTYRGVVGFISSEAEFTPKTVQTPKERVKLVFRIKIDLQNPDDELKPGMPADAVLR